MITINKNFIRIEDSTITNSKDTDSWVFKISETLANHPSDWKELSESKKFYTIIKTEFDELTKAKSHLELHSDSDMENYKRALVHLASACVNNLMEV